jgi:phosphoglycolate phosphatase-like HAD superfamily hydrolase
MIQKIIFDFDDTITDNQLLDYMAFDIPCKKLDIKVPTRNKIRNGRKKGLLAKDIIVPYLEKFKSTTENRFFYLRNQFLNNTNCSKYLQPQKNLRLLLGNLKDRKIECIICSSKENKNIIIKFLEESDLIDYFSAIYVNSDLGFQLDNHGKENRVLIKRSLLHSILKKEKEEIVFIGNFEDYEASRGLRLKFIYYQNSYLEFHNLKQTITVKDMIQLNRTINQLGNTK